MTNRLIPTNAEPLYRQLMGAHSRRCVQRRVSGGKPDSVRAGDVRALQRQPRDRPPRHQRIDGRGNSAQAAGQRHVRLHAQAMP